jgi:hypothetical protein
MLYTETPEHAHMVLCEKAAYADLPPYAQCLRLVEKFGKALDLDVQLPFAADPERPGMWTLEVWRRNKRFDILRAVTLGLCSEIPGAPRPRPSSVVIEVINDRTPNSDPQPPLVISRAFRGAAEAESKSKGSITTDLQPPVTAAGIPLVALQFASVRLTVACPVDPGPATLRVRVLATDERRRTACLPHNVTAIVMDDHGAFVEHKMFIASGNMGQGALGCCAIM